jgi:hypothetical protein
MADLPRQALLAFLTHHPLLERDRFPETLAARKGLPQGRHAHILLERGRVVVERFLPELTGELVQAGAEPLDFTRDIAWMSPGGWYVRFPGDLRLLNCTRDLIDWGVRRRVAALPNLRIHQGARRIGRLTQPRLPGASCADCGLCPICTLYGWMYTTPEGPVLHRMNPRG